MVNSGGFKNALLLNGETRSRVYSPKDRKTAFLFGDAGTAALISKNEKFGESTFDLNSDGSLGDLIKMDHGGYRNPTTHESSEEKVIDEYGNIRSGEHGYMNGPEVFNFVLREIPRSVKNLLKLAERDESSIDYFVFHQANTFMNNYLADKMKLPKEKCPSNIKAFGNTSSVSIPLAIATELKDKLHGSKTLFLSGFGVGMSWANAIVSFQDCKISPLVEI
jgi:3-oxoacyl-[acyl-carrier-protein] synthase-3